MHDASPTHLHLILDLASWSELVAEGRATNNNTKNINVECGGRGGELRNVYLCWMDNGLKNLRPSGLLEINKMFKVVQYFVHQQSWKPGVASALKVDSSVSQYASSFERFEIETRSCNTPKQNCPCIPIMHFSLHACACTCPWERARGVPV